jgi:hypothetical protein
MLQAVELDAIAHASPAGKAMPRYMVSSTLAAGDPGWTSEDATKLNLVEHEVYSNGIQKQVFDVVR